MLVNVDLDIAHSVNCPYQEVRISLVNFFASDHPGVYKVEIAGRK